MSTPRPSSDLKATPAASPREIQELKTQMEAFAKGGKHNRTFFLACKLALADPDNFKIPDNFPDNVHFKDDLEKNRFFLDLLRHRELLLAKANGNLDLAVLALPPPTEIRTVLESAMSKMKVTPQKQKIDPLKEDDFKKRLDEFLKENFPPSPLDSKNHVFHDTKKLSACLEKAFESKDRVLIEALFAGATRRSLGITGAQFLLYNKLFDMEMDRYRRINARPDLKLLEYYRILESLASDISGRPIPNATENLTEKRKLLLKMYLEGELSDACIAKFNESFLPRHAHPANLNQQYTELSALLFLPRRILLEFSLQDEPWAVKAQYESLGQGNQKSADIPQKLVSHLQATEPYLQRDSKKEKTFLYACKCGALIKDFEFKHSDPEERKFYQSFMRHKESLLKKVGGDRHNLDEAIVLHLWQEERDGNVSPRFRAGLEKAYDGLQMMEFLQLRLSQHDPDLAAIAFIRNQVVNVRIEDRKSNTFPRKDRRSLNDNEKKFLGTFSKALSCLSKSAVSAHAKHYVRDLLLKSLRKHEMTKISGSEDISFVILQSLGKGKNEAWKREKHWNNGVPSEKEAVEIEAAQNLIRDLHRASKGEEQRLFDRFLERTISFAPPASDAMSSEKDSMELREMRRPTLFGSSTAASASGNTANSAKASATAADATATDTSRKATTPGLKRGANNDES